MTYEVYAFSRNVCCGWAGNKTAIYRDPRCTCRGPAKCCVIRQKSRINRICWGSVKYHTMCLCSMYVGDMRLTEPQYIESPRDVCSGSGSVDLDDFMMFVPFPIVYAVGIWWTNPRHIGIPDTCAGDQLNDVFICWKSRVYRICWGSGRYHITFLSGMYIGVMRCTEPRYIESPRDVCWGSGH